MKLRNIMPNKKGIELSINFFVLLTLAIVVLGLGLKFSSDLFGKANQISKQMDQDTQRRIEAMLDRGELLSVPITSKDISGKDVAIFGIGLLNIKDTTTFTVAVTCDIVLDRNGNEFTKSSETAACAKMGILLSPTQYTMKKNDKQLISIGAVPASDAPSGTYGLTVKVTYLDDNGAEQIYGGAPKQIYVNLS